MMPQLRKLRMFATLGATLFSGLIPATHGIPRCDRDPSRPKAVSFVLQDTVTGALEGLVVDSEIGIPIVGASVQVINEQTGVSVDTRTDSKGRFYQGQLAPGIYRIIISAPGFKSKTFVQQLRITYTSIIVPMPIPLERENKSTGVTANSSPTFVAKWNEFELWEGPAKWQGTSTRLLLNEHGIALPRDKAYRSYSDFTLISDVRMLNGVAASFVVHALDQRNYYLIQVTGPNADEPYVLRGFIVRDGNLQRWKTIPIDAYTTTLQQNRFFELSMKMTGHNLEVSVTDSENGSTVTLGTLSDPSHTFPTGAIGIAVRDNEQNEIGRFIVSVF